MPCHIFLSPRLPDILLRLTPKQKNTGQPDTSLGLTLSILHIHPMMTGKAPDLTGILNYGT